MKDKNKIMKMEPSNRRWLSEKKAGRNTSNKIELEKKGAN